MTTATYTTPLAAYRAVDALEGSARDGVVISKFDTMEAASAFYDSAEYQAAVKHRFLGANYRDDCRRAGPLTRIREPVTRRTLPRSAVSVRPI